jgi:hypothetical protein
LDLRVYFLRVDRKDYCQGEGYLDVEQKELVIRKDYFQGEECLVVVVEQLVIVELLDFQQLFQQEYRLVQFF